MSTQAEAKAALKAANGNYAQAARALGMDRMTFKRRLKGVPAAAPRTARPAAAPKAAIVAGAAAAGAKAGRSLDDFRAQFDRNYIVPQKVRAGLAQLGAGWEYEVEFARLCGVSVMDLGLVRAQFEEHLVQVRRDGKRVWVGSKAAAQKMREMVR